MSDPHLATPGVVAWRTRQLVSIVLAAGLVLAGLTLVASQANPDAVELAATRWLQQFDSPVFAAFMAAVSWFGFAPQTLVMPVVLAGPFAVRRLWVEALLVLGSQSASLVTIIMKDVVHRSRPSPTLVGVLMPLTDPSFPSGHVVQYTALFGVAFFLVYVLAQPSARRTVGLVLLAIPIVLVGPSRLYLGPALAERRDGRLRRGRHAACSVLLGVCEVALGCHTSSIQAHGFSRGWADPASTNHRWPTYCSRNSHQP